MFSVVVYELVLHVMLSGLNYNIINYVVKKLNSE